MDACDCRGVGCARCAPLQTKPAGWVAARAAGKQPNYDTEHFAASQLLRPHDGRVVFPKGFGGPGVERPTGTGSLSVPLPAYAAVDERTRNTWEYPCSEDFPDREYQLEIASVALFQNTLVALPTGLGKTFIAAVVMYNFYRWFPKGQVVFLAPTRPLVTQQISACFHVVGIPAQDTAQMCGGVGTDKRTAWWAQRRVFYCTPQTFGNDIRAGRLDPARIVLVVVDEGAPREIGLLAAAAVFCTTTIPFVTLPSAAHRATKNHAFVTCIQALDARRARYRLLALSATPGTDLNKVGRESRNRRRRGCCIDVHMLCVVVAGARRRESIARVTYRGGIHGCAAASMPLT